MLEPHIIVRLGREEYLDVAVPVYAGSHTSFAMADDLADFYHLYESTKRRERISLTRSTTCLVVAITSIRLGPTHDTVEVY